ncbi:peptidylprolyl isomerase [Egbenema bharatensis]|uniref:peptidylprolyl isomerase n=1 Tax=Egbenema bharatensis TaxID=3463334 RepID=UPI003A889557
MNTPTFLYIDDHPITIEQIIDYLQTSGQLSSFISTVLQQHVLKQELQNCPQAKVSAEQIQQIITNFRQENQLLDDQHYQQWLAQQGLTRTAFEQNITHQFQMNQFLPTIVEPKLQETFIDQKLHLDQVVLSRLVVENWELAEELKAQIIEEAASFEQLVREYSISGDRVVNGMLGTISRGQLPDALRVAIDLAKVGDIVGPIEIDQKWCLFRLEQFLPASLANEEVQQLLCNTIFDQWIAQKLHDKRVQLRVA